MRLQSLNRFQLGEGFVAHTPAVSRRQPRAHNWKTRRGQELSWLLRGSHFVHTQGSPMAWARNSPERAGHCSLSMHCTETAQTSSLPLSWHRTGCGGQQRGDTMGKQTRGEQGCVVAGAQQQSNPCWVAATQQAWDCCCGHRARQRDPVLPVSPCWVVAGWDGGRPQEQLLEKRGGSGHRAGVGLGRAGR